MCTVQDINRYVSKEIKKNGKVEFFRVEEYSNIKRFFLNKEIDRYSVKNYDKDIQKLFQLDIYDMEKTVKKFFPRYIVKNIINIKHNKIIRTIEISATQY